MKMYKNIVLLLVIIYTITSCTTQESVHWKDFSEASKNNSTLKQLPDFSYAGHDFGESELPVILDLPKFKVESFGAIANDGLSDSEAIRKAIAAAEKAKSGIVLFGKGKYLINEQKGLSESIVIKGGNIVLKGVGDEESGTVLFMKRALEPTDPEKLWTTPAIIHFTGKNNATAIGNLITPVKKGDFVIEVDGFENIQKGDVIGIFAKGVFLNKQFLNGKKTRARWTTINTNGAYVNELHEVAAVLGNKITFRAPILLDMKVGEPWEIKKMDFIENCGFEDIRFVGNFHEPFVHHKNALHDGGYSAVKMSSTTNSWVRNCTFVNVNIAATINNSLCGTLYNNWVLGNGGHSSFGLQKSTRGLIAYCKDQANQWHGPNASHGSVGSVILRFKGKNRGIDTHAAFPRVTLFDQNVMAGFDGDSVGRASHGGHFKNLPNHLDGLVLWNFKQTALPRPNFNFWDLMQDKPNENYGPLTAVDPIIVGFQGKGTSFVEESTGAVEAFGKPITPGSLYLAQLKLRTSKIPAYLKKVTHKIK